MLSQHRQTPLQPARQCLLWQWCLPPAHLPAEQHHLLGSYLNWDVSRKYGDCQICCMTCDLKYCQFGCEGIADLAADVHSFAMAMLPSLCTLGSLCAAHRGLKWKGRGDVCQPITRPAGHALQRADGAPCQLSSVCEPQPPQRMLSRLIVMHLQRSLLCHSERFWVRIPAQN